MDMRQAICYLFENKLRVRLLQSPFAFDESEEVSATGVLHDHEQMLAAFKDFKETDDVRVFDLLQEVDLLKYLALREVVLHIRLLDGLNCHVLSSELMYPKSDFTKRPLSYKFHELIIL